MEQSRLLKRKLKALWRFVLVGLGLSFFISGLFWKLLKYFPHSDSSIKIIPAETQKHDAENIQITDIIIDVSGAVINPGIYQLKSDARMAQAIQQAGGLREDADLDYLSKNINLSQKLKDGVKVYIPTKDDQLTLLRQGNKGQASEMAGESARLININTASQLDLDSLWGVGESRAQEIIKNRPYSNIQELLDKKIIPSNVYERIKEEISV